MATWIAKVTLFTPESRWQEAAELPGIPGVAVAGVHCHIGSQITDPAGYEETARKMLAFAREPSRDAPLTDTDPRSAPPESACWDATAPA